MATPKNPLRDNDKWGVGQRADGSINIMTEEEARKARAIRDGEDEAFSEMMNQDTTEDQNLDLNGMSIEELDELIEGLDVNE